MTLGGRAAEAITFKKITTGDMTEEYQFGRDAYKCLLFIYFVLEANEIWYSGRSIIDTKCFMHKKVAFDQKWVPTNVEFQSC